MDLTAAKESMDAKQQAQGFVYMSLVQPAKLDHLNKMSSLAIILMDMHGLKPGHTDGWHFQWNHRATLVAGSCNTRKKILSFSVQLLALWPESECKETFLHEIAHALEPVGIHTVAWRRRFIAIGGSGKVTYDVDRLPAAAPRRPQRRNFRGTCPNGHSIERVRMPKQSGSCSQCSTRYDERYLLTWTRI